jgi:hypothetical protein
MYRPRRRTPTDYLDDHQPIGIGRLGMRLPPSALDTLVFGWLARASEAFERLTHPYKYPYSKG